MSWRGQQIFTAVWIAVQIGLPLHYYLVRWHADPVNEMYAWRMFSDTFHGASAVEWFWFDGGNDDGHGLSKSDLVADAGLSRRWAKVATGEYGKAHTRAPDLYVMKRVGEHLCATLPKIPRFANITSVGAVRSTLDWSSTDAHTQEFVWDC